MGERGIPRRLGTMDCRRVSWEADVTTSSETMILRLKRPMLSVERLSQRGCAFVRVLFECPVSKCSFVRSFVRWCVCLFVLFVRVVSIVRIVRPTSLCCSHRPTSTATIILSNNTVQQYCSYIHSLVRFASLSVSDRINSSTPSIYLRNPLAQASPSHTIRHS